MRTEGTPHARTFAAAAAVLLTVAAIVVLAPAANARVQVSSPDAKPGAKSATLVFTVPNDSNKFETIQIQVTLPLATPFTQVRAQDIPGWTAKLTATPLPNPVRVGGERVDKAVTAVNWVSTGKGIAPGAFEEFKLSVGPLPRIGPLVLPVLQWFSNHTTVQWGQLTRPDGDQPRHPAPVLQFGPTSAPAPAQVEPTAASATRSSQAPAADHSELAMVLAGIAVALSLVAVVVLLVARLRTRSVRPGGDSL